MSAAGSAEAFGDAPVLKRIFTLNIKTFAETVFNVSQVRDPFGDCRHFVPLHDNSEAFLWLDG